MKRALWMTFLAIILSFNPQPALAEESDVSPLYPFLDASTETFVSEPYFQESFLEFLENNSVYPVIDEERLPLLYFAEEPGLGCEGFCSNITFNNHTFGSKTMDSSNLPEMEDLKERMVMGSGELEKSMDTINAVRTALKSDPEALAEFERYLAGEQEGPIKGTYYDELYDDVWDYAVSEMEKDPAFYGPLLKEMKTDDLEGAIERMDDYLQENFDMNGAFDIASMYSAIENGQLGNIQTEELMRNVLKEIAGQEGMDIDMDGLDLEGLSDLLDTDEFRGALKKASEMMKENPEMFDRLSDLSREMMDNPETREVFKDALKEMMENSDWDAMKDLMEAFSKMDNKDDLLQMLSESMGEYMRQMVESGQMDQMMEMMSDPAVKEMMSEAFQSFSQEMLESAWDRLKEIPAEFSYVVAIIAILATLVILMKLKM